MKKKLRICKGCGKKFKPKAPQQFFHNVKCRTKFYNEKNKEEMKRKGKLYYQTHKEQYEKTAKRWALNNPHKAKAMHKRAMKKYLENNREHFNERSRMYYIKHKEQHLSRTKVYKLLRVYKVKICKLNKVCSVCSSRYKVWLFFDIYPLTKENILKAIKKNKIRYLCRRHWVEALKEKRRKWMKQNKR